MLHTADMRTAFIDLANKENIFALTSEDSVLSSVSVPDHKDEEQLMPLFQKVLDDANVSINDVTQIACVVGPGGFTTLRVAVAMTNALSYGLGIPSCGLHASDLWKARIGDADCIWLHSTKKTQLFLRGFGKYEQQWNEPTLVTLDEARLLVTRCAFVGDVLPEHVEALNLQEVEDLQSLDAVLPALLSSQTYKQQILEPWYGRER